MSLKCDRCKDLKCRQAERNCKGFLDAAGKWIGGVVNAAGRATCIRNQGDMLGDMALSPTFSFSPPSVSHKDARMHAVIPQVPIGQIV